MSFDCYKAELEQVLELIKNLLRQNLPLEDFRRLYSAQMHLLTGERTSLEITKKQLLEISKGKSNLSVHSLLLMGLLEAYDLNLDSSLLYINNYIDQIQILTGKQRNNGLVGRAKVLYHTIKEEQRVLNIFDAALDSSTESVKQNSIKDLALREACLYLTDIRAIIKKSKNST